MKSTYSLHWSPNFKHEYAIPRIIMKKLRAFFLANLAVFS